ncbi:hypothetical protein AAF712_011906, partial [Marasmius tenuissimus]
LWTNLEVTLRPQYLHPLRLAIARSQQLPLSLVLDDYYDPIKEAEVLRFVLQHSCRWLHIDLIGVTPPTIVMLENASTPVLESVTCPSHRIGMIFDHLLPSPCLKYIKCKGTIMDFEPFEQVEFFPWATIRHLDMDFREATEPLAVSDILRFGQELESLVYSGEAAIGDVEAEPYKLSDDLPEPIVSNLAALAIRFSDIEGFHDLLHDFIQCVTLPRLAKLEISFVTHIGRKESLHERAIWPRQALFDFFERSGCNLTELILQKTPLKESDLISLLQLTPSLRSFTFSELWSATYIKKPQQELLHTITRSFLRRLEALTFTVDAFSTHHFLLPKLRYLELGVQSHFDADEGFVEVVRSRWVRSNVGDVFPAAERLREVVLRVAGKKVDEDIYAPLRRMNEEGLMISVFGNGVRVV